MPARCEKCGATPANFVIADPPIGGFCAGCIEDAKALPGVVTYIELHDDGRRTFHTDPDAFYAAGLLDHEGAPELTREQFDELTARMKKARKKTSG